MSSEERQRDYETRRTGFERTCSNATGAKVRFFFLRITNVTILSKGNMPRAGEVMQCCAYDVLVMAIYLELLDTNGYNAELIGSFALKHMHENSRCVSRTGKCCR